MRQRLRAQFAEIGLKPRLRLRRRGAGKCHCKKGCKTDGPCPTRYAVPPRHAACLPQPRSDMNPLRAQALHKRARPAYRASQRGEVAEWFKAAVLKTACENTAQPALSLESQHFSNRSSRVPRSFAKNMQARRTAQ
ncbi:hypothetical protein GCM10009106_09050 [Sphingomonas japonica]